MVRKPIRQNAAGDANQPSTEATDAPALARAGTPPVVLVQPEEATPWRPFRVETILTAGQVRAEYFARKAELDRQHRAARRALKKHFADILSGKYGPVTGVTVSFRQRYGEIVSPLQYAITINVPQKRPLNDLPPAIPFPKHFDNVPVKVREGAYELLHGASVRAVPLRGQDLPNNPPPFGTPLRGGIPVCIEQVMKSFGTLGIHLPGGNDPAIQRGLTNQHVAAQGDAIHQVGPSQAGNSAPTRPIGRATASSTAKIGGRTVDCAVVEFDQGISVDPAIHPRGYTASRPVFFSSRNVRPSDIGSRVVKFGARTGELLEGSILEAVISRVDTATMIYFNAFSAKRGNQSFVLGGDSGSVVAVCGTVRVQGVATPSYIAVGLVFGAPENNASTALCCHMCDVVKALKLTLPPALLTRDWDPEVAD